jgi:hypothetical protein
MQEAEKREPAAQMSRKPRKVAFIMLPASMTVSVRVAVPYLTLFWFYNVI